MYLESNEFISEGVFSYLNHPPKEGSTFYDAQGSIMPCGLMNTKSGYYHIEINILKPIMNINTSSSRIREFNIQISATELVLSCINNSISISFKKIE